MRHRKAGRQFGRDTSSRRAMLRNLTANLITHERIETTDAKAKELRRVAERLITKATRLGEVAHTVQGELSAGDKARRLHATRLVAAYVPRWGVKSDGTKIDIVEKVMTDLSKRFAGRPAATPARPSSARAAATARRWSSSSSSTPLPPKTKPPPAPVTAAEPSEGAASAS